MARVDLGSLFEARQKSLTEEIRPGMSEQEQRALFQSAAAYAGDVESALNTLARECGCAVLNSAAILRLPETASAGLPDMTARLREILGRGP
jgi:hypothetical protein